MAMNSYIPQITRNLRNVPNAIVTKPYGQHTVNFNTATNSIPQHQHQQIPFQTTYYQPQQVFFVPYGTPFVYTGVPVQTYYQPITYPTFQPQQQPQPQQPQFNTQTYQQHAFARRKKYSTERIAFSEVSDSFEYNNTPGLAGVTELLEETDDTRGNYSIHMDVGELNRSIRQQLETTKSCRVSWLNRMISKSNSTEDFEQALELYQIFQEKNLEVTPETATLLIKAACRAEIPEKALELMQDTNKINISPTLGGIHYLMINFSLKKDTTSVMKAYEIIKNRKMSPNARTFHILIRECIDNDLVKEAIEFSKESKKLDILPNRVTCNILMNGLRKFNKGKEILELREQMNGSNIDINDTTIKFTVLAYMMLNKKKEAVAEFMNYKKLDIDLNKFCTKFFETSEESEDQMKLAIDLFKQLKNEITLPESVIKKLGASLSN